MDHRYRGLRASRGNNSCRIHNGQLYRDYELHDHYAARYSDGLLQRSKPDGHSDGHSIDLSFPASVKGGKFSTGTVILTSPAPTGGAIVALSTSSTSFSTVPASVTVAAGAVQQTFTVKARSTLLSRAATITATYWGTSKTANLTIT